MGFTHLHVHTEYSLLDGLGKAEEIAKKCKKNGMTACAITDHGVMYGVVTFFDACIKEGIKPIIGSEVYVAPESRFDRKGKADDQPYYHLVLLVKNETGYKNLCRLVSRSNTEGFYYKPRIDFELLKQYHEGLICLTACVGGQIPQMILSGNMEEARRLILEYKELFGDDFYLEIQNHGLYEERIVADALINFSRELGIKLVCTNDCHYVDSEDAEAHQWLICMQTKKTIHDEDKIVYRGDYSVKTEEEMRRLFPGFQDAFDNTMEIAEKCNFKFKFTSSYADYYMPKVVVPEKYNGSCFAYIKDEAMKGFERRYPAPHVRRTEAKKQLEYELSVIEQMGFEKYFLITRDTIIWAKKNDVIVGPGRGSAVGSVMCYCLDITDIEPIKYGLLFERFLNPERVSMPDIDVDFQYSRKDDVIAYEAGVNGKQNFSKIITFGTLAAKEIMRSCARVAGYPVSTGDKLASFVPKETGITLTKAYDGNPEFRDYIKAEGLENLWSIALKIEGTKKNTSLHACGHVPTPVPCEELFPVSVDQETGYLVSQYDAPQLERLGLLKKDLLMLRNLTIIDTVHKEVKRKYGKEIPLWTEEILNDKKALELIASGQTDGVFQLESDGMKGFMRELCPDCFEDIIAGVALYRPGPMDFIPRYIEGKKNPETVTYLTPELEEILKPTYGVICYQEQVIQIVQKLAGFSKGRADVVRKGVAKKKQDIMERESLHFFYGNEGLGIPGCVKNGISEEIAKQIWGEMADFAKYAFNKSHAAAYAAIAMQTAYLKAHYPEEFMAGLLTSVMDKPDKLVPYINTCRKTGIEILSPDINTSGKDFTVDGRALRYGLSALKGVGFAAVDAIVAERSHGPFESLSDFIKRMHAVCNKACVSALVKAGAFDFTGYTRRAMVNNIDQIFASVKGEEKRSIPGQMSFADFFDMNEIGEFFGKDTFSDEPEYQLLELLKAEKEASGFYISGHPISHYDRYVKKARAIKLSAFSENEEDGTFGVENDKSCFVAGIITDKRQVFTKKGDLMEFLKIEDETGALDVTVFPKTYSKYASMLREDVPVVIYGKSNIRNGSMSLIAEEIVDLDHIPEDVCIRLKRYDHFAQDEVNKIMAPFFSTRGGSLMVFSEEGKGWYRPVNGKLAVERSELMEFTLKNHFGEENVVFREHDVFSEWFGKQIRR